MTPALFGCQLFSICLLFRFDDGDELDGIEDCYVFNKEDYLLTMRCSDRLSNWIGVKNVVDEKSKDSWAKLVGWVSRSPFHVLQTQQYLTPFS